MTTLREEAYRALLDDRGVLRPGALAPPPRSAAFTVFGQRPDAALDVGAMRSHAARFFGADLGLTVDKRYGANPPQTDAARVVLAADGGGVRGTRLCFGRPTEDEDLAAAEEAERAQGTTGMALLSRRCPIVWLVVTEDDDDRVALTIAAIFASTLLGPILPPAGDALHGVRTARLKLEQR